MSLPDRLSNTSTRDEPALALGRRDKDVDTSDSTAGGLMQKCVIIQRDEKGYGFTVSGDNPVFVASVKQDGAAARAGVQNGDRIVKVNGTLVTQRNHLDVVKLIKSGSYVALTLLGKPSPSSFSGLYGHPSSLPLIRDSIVGRVTAPQPVDPDKDKELWQQKVHMTRAMHEAAKEDFEKLQKQYVGKPSEKLHSQLLEKERTVKALDNQLKQLTGVIDPGMTSQLPTTTSDLGSLSDSSQTSPSVSPTPDEFHIRHNGQDIKYLINQQEIIHPEYEEDSSEEDQLNVSPRSAGRYTSPAITKVNDPGPFADVKLLENKPAHMAVLLNYLISNSDPAPVLFHIISDLYSRSAGNNKELRKWAYEIFSTFIYKMAPLSISVEENITTQTDSILTSSGSKTDNENILRSMFLPARQSVQMEIAELLADFRSKKYLGMGTLYGIQKIHDNMDKAAEVKVAEELLMPHLKYFGVVDNSRSVLVDKDLATGWALATFLRSLSGTKSASSITLDRVQTFMMKDKKSIKFPGSRSSRAKAVKGHQFSLQHFYVTTFCTFCGNLIWGVGYQGYQCQNCEIILHKFCADEITEQCGGKHKRRISAKLPLTAVIPNRRFSSVNPGHPQQQSAQDQTSPTPATAPSPPHTDILTQPYPKDEDSELVISGGHSVQSMVNRFQELASPIGPAQGSLVEPADATATQGSDRKDTTNLNRAGSLNSKGKKSERPARRAKSDVDVDSDTFKEIHQSASSSASSLSNRSADSPGSSSDNMHDLLRTQCDDPDMDVEPELPPLKQVLPEDVLRKLKPKDKKRQEVINELFYTERAHLRNLKVLDLLFNQPMYQEKGIMAELARALFPNMEEMISLHVTLVNDMKERSQSTAVVRDVGDILLKRFDGEAGDRFSKGCAEYCRNQAFALDALKKQTRKELKLQQFLQDAESNSLCRRLQLKDLVPCQMQRLTKYPLLIDNLLKYTNSHSEEYRRLERTLEKCKHILAYVNQTVKECENYHKLKDIQKKLDRRSLEGLNDPAVAELKNLDLTQHKLIFDSPLTWKLRSHRTVDLHVLLLEDLLVLLQKQDDRYVLKGQNTNVQPARDDKYTHFPILRLQNLLARTLATEKRSFFVVNISESRAQMYEFTAASSELRVKWCKLINDKADEFKSTLAYMHDAGQTSQSTTRLSRIPAISPSGQFEQTNNSPAEDIFEITEKLSRRLDIAEDHHADGELILPEEVCVSDAITSKSSTVSSPLATLSPEVSSHQIQPPALLLQQTSLQHPVSMDQLNDMVSQMNVIVSKLVGAVNSEEEKPSLRRELQKAQLGLDTLKQKKRQMTEAETLLSGTSSPGVPSDIPLTSEMSNTRTSPNMASSPTSAQGLEEFSATLTSVLSTDLPLLAQQEANMLKEKYGLDSSTQGGISPTSAPVAGEQSRFGLHGSVHHGIQEATVTQIEESLEHLSLCSEPDQMVQVVAMETATSEADLASEHLPIEDYDYDDSHEVSIADLPLPDPVSICSADPAASRQFLHHLDCDEIEVDSDDYESLTSSTSYQAVTSEAVTFGKHEMVHSSTVQDTEIVTSNFGAREGSGDTLESTDEGEPSTSCDGLDGSSV